MRIDKWYCWNCGYKTIAYTMHTAYIDSIDSNCPKCQKTMTRQSPDPGENVKVIRTKAEEKKRRRR